MHEVFVDPSRSGPHRRKGAHFCKESLLLLIRGSKHSHGKEADDLGSGYVESMSTPVGWREGPDKDQTGGRVGTVVQIGERSEDVYNAFHKLKRLTKKLINMRGLLFRLET
jgi:hypothetical protein